eukprot:gnl/Trimastix_PCT/2358.p2 GENE.gnl/Trimastix_PCT/2358~~gnl/Trimastix_PCT/2358.p2  ORF type:complete len:180 (-),score=54.26 gnl/Trimastix_PCT/2358:19-558(-)
MKYLLLFALVALALCEFDFLDFSKGVEVKHVKKSCPPGDTKPGGFDKKAFDNQYWKMDGAKWEVNNDHKEFNKGSKWGGQSHDYAKNFNQGSRITHGGSDKTRVEKECIADTIRQKSFDYSAGRDQLYDLDLDVSKDYRTGGSKHNYDSTKFHQNKEGKYFKGAQHRNFDTEIKKYFFH